MSPRRNVQSYLSGAVVCLAISILTGISGYGIGYEEGRKSGAETGYMAGEAEGKEKAARIAAKLLLEQRVYFENKPWEACL